MSTTRYSGAPSEVPASLRLSPRIRRETLARLIETASAALDSDRDTARACIAKAAARQTLGPAEPVAQAIVAAVEVRRPKRRYAAGSGVAVFGVLAHLPVSLRERLIKTVFGLG